MKGKPSQRDFMRQLVKTHGNQKERVCAAYVRAEAAGSVDRKSTLKTSEAYADALWRDGVHKGWLDL